MNNLKFNLALLLALLLWASAFVGIRIGLEGGYSFGALAFLRLTVASLCLLCMTYRLTNATTIPWRDRCSLALLGVIGIGIYHVCLNYGEVTVSAGVASFIVGLMPVITVLLAWIFFHERMTAVLWLGVGISFFGLLLIILDESDKIGFDWGVIAVLITAIAGSILNIWQKPWLKKYHLVDVTAWIMWGGTLSIIFFAPLFFKEFFTASWKATLAGIYLGIFPAAFANVAWGYVLHTWSVSKASITLYSLPVLSTIMGYCILGEKISLLAFTGGLIAVAGAFIANHFGHKTTPGGNK